jgi:hypothetical protein
MSAKAKAKMGGAQQLNLGFAPHRVRMLPLASASVPPPTGLSASDDLAWLQALQSTDADVSNTIAAVAPPVVVADAAVSANIAEVAPAIAVAAAAVSETVAAVAPSVAVEVAAADAEIPEAAENAEADAAGAEAAPGSVADGANSEPEVFVGVD